MGKKIRKGKEVEGKNEGEKRKGILENGMKMEMERRGRGKTQICERK